MKTVIEQVPGPPGLPQPQLPCQQRGRKALPGGGWCGGGRGGCGGGRGRGGNVIGDGHHDLIIIYNYKVW